MKLEKVRNEKVRVEVIQTICSNLIMARLLLPEGRKHYLAKLESQNNILLGLTLVESKYLLSMSLELTALRNKN